MHTSLAILGSLVLACTTGAADRAPVGAEPALELIASTELESPLSVELQVAPVFLDRNDDFRRLFRDPRFPSVFLRRHGGLYAAFRRHGTTSQGRTLRTVPSDIVYFVGRPDLEAIEKIWPDAVVQTNRATPQPEPSVDTARPALMGTTDVRTPRMAHAPSRVRRLEALSAKYAPSTSD